MLNFNEKAGTPVHLFNSENPVFYLDTTDLDMIKNMVELGERLKGFNPELIEDETEVFKLINEEITYIGEKIDEAFGEGVSKVAMNGTKSIEQLSLFLNFIITSTGSERERLTSKYTKNREQKRATKKGVI